MKPMMVNEKSDKSEKNDGDDAWEQKAEVKAKSRNPEGTQPPI